ncbi:MAG: heavy-metal-associated domain-containing protein [bacterium]
MNIPRMLLPLLVVAALLGGYLLRAQFTQPTTSVSFQHGGSARLECVVDGVKCKGTAAFFTRLYDGIPGIASIETFATEHKAIFTYEPSIITPEQIRRIMEEPIPLRDGSRQQVFQCVSMQ